MSEVVKTERQGDNEYRLALDEDSAMFTIRDNSDPESQKKSFYISRDEAKMFLKLLQSVLT